MIILFKIDDVGAAIIRCSSN